MVATVTLTGEFRKLDGTPAEGTVRLVPSIPVIRDGAGNVILSGRQDFPLTDGALSADLPATDLPGQPFTYQAWVRLHHDSHGPFTVTLPTEAVSVDLADLPWPAPPPPDAGESTGGLTVVVSTTEPAPGVVWLNPEEDA